MPLPHTSGSGDVASSNADLPPPSSWRLSDVDLHRTIGLGAHSRVRIGRIRGSAAAAPSVAVKVIKKADVFSNREYVDALRASLDLHADLSAQRQRALDDDGGAALPAAPTYTAAQYAYFSDKRRLFFVSELLEGGALFSHTQADGRFAPDAAKYYAASLVLALSTLHDAGRTHGALRPEHIMLDRRGRLRLVGLVGASKKIAGDAAVATREDGTPSGAAATPTPSTSPAPLGHMSPSAFGSPAPAIPPQLSAESILIGSPEYLAPELLQVSDVPVGGDGGLIPPALRAANGAVTPEPTTAAGGPAMQFEYDPRAADFWALGAVVYEMFTGYPPFFSDEPLRLLALIREARPVYPPTMDARAVDLVRSLLEPDPARRLGVLQRGVSDVKRHAFFAGLDWESLAEGRLAPPASILAAASGAVLNPHALEKKGTPTVTAAPVAAPPCVSFSQFDKFDESDGAYDDDSFEDASWDEAQFAGF